MGKINGIKVKMRPVASWAQSRREIHIVLQPTEAPVIVCLDHIVIDNALFHFIIPRAMHNGPWPRRIIT